MTSARKNQFYKNPAAFLDQAIRSYIADCPNDRFMALPDELTCDKPIIVELYSCLSQLQYQTEENNAPAS